MTKAPFAGLAVQDLRVEFDLYGGITKVLDGINLCVDTNQRVGVVGETGCGKSLTMMTALGMLRRPPARIVGGEILFDGRNVLAMSHRELRRLRGSRMSIVFQDPMTSLNPVFTIRKQMEFVVRRARFARNTRGRKSFALLESALEEMNLPDPRRILSSYPMQLSGGMRQRVLIAMAIINKPDLLFADEIGTALDVTVQAQVIRQLEALVLQRGMALVAISHNLGVIRQLCEHVYVMYAGQVVEEAPSDELFRCPLHPYTRALIEALPRLTGGSLSKGIPGRIPDYSDPPTGCRYNPRCALSNPSCEVRPPIQDAGAKHTYACIHAPAHLAAKYGTEARVRGAAS